ncbi:RNA-binding protein S4 [Paraliobacillus quinghaiensis]|uniref:RNA-binding protein S4 n=1 Tax=Paraliobacillus quinghaiensis TaxID=470815 RepID=A0A917TEM4_9BACI|nr:RNA-binding protein [Paraliobacillus quinghaiensis]GGM20751.1 RNA-binding protein S4 [Paraliobacillus quinghaiensis]
MEIYQHFRKEEQPFIDQVLSWRDQVEKQYQRRDSDFLDPREQKIYRSLIGNDEQFVLSFFGGTSETERKQAILAPYYETIEEMDFPITLLEATYPTKFMTIEHRDVLGAFLSLGLKRKKLGDVFINDGLIQLMVSADIESFVKFNLTTIKKASIEWTEKPLHDALKSNDTWLSHTTTVSSLRLDVMMKELYGVSRQNAAQAIQKGLVKVNFRIVENPSFVVEEGDVFSFRSKGRSRLTEVAGQTKKDKWRISFETLK